MKLPRFCLGVLFAGWLVACSTPKDGVETFDPAVGRVGPVVKLEPGDTRVVGSTLDDSLTEPPSEPFRLGPGDRIEIQVLGDPTTLAETFVCPDGKIYYHLLPGQFVWGRTLHETKALLEEGLEKYLQRPRVSITLREVKSRRIWILGRVYRSGVYPLVRPMQLLEAIARAGGLMVSGFTASTEELADLHHSFIVRNGRMLPVDFHALLREGDMQQNIYLRPDDFIYLPSSLAQEVYVLGEVLKPTNVPFMNQVTLVGAISKARGPTKQAYTEQVAIIRGSLSNPRVAIVNYNEILVGKRPNIALEARDIVYVPDRRYENVLNYGRLIVDTFVRTVAANEGSRAAVQSADTVGVNIQIGNE